MRTFKLFLSLLFVVQNGNSQGVVTGPPPGSGGYWYSPDGTQNWNFSGPPAPPGGNGLGPGRNGENGSGRGGSGNGPGGGPSSHGMGIGVDLAGMARLAATIEAGKRRKEAIQRYQSDSVRFYTELTKKNSTVLTANDLKKVEPIVLATETTFDDADRKLLIESGEAIILHSFADFANLTNTLKGLGFPISLESIHFETDDKFQVPWVLMAIEPIESQQLETRVAKAVQNTETWIQEAKVRSDKIAGDVTETYRQAQVVELPTVRAPTRSKSYEIKTQNRIHRRQLEDIQEKLTDAKPTTPQSRMAKYIGQYAITQADQASIAGSKDAYHVWTEIAVTMTDIALGFVPVVGTAKDLWEAITGQSILTGDLLSPEERFLAAASALTLGVGGFLAKSLKAGVKGADAIVNGAEAIQKTSLKLGRGKLVPEVSQWSRKLAKIAEAESFAGMKAQRIIPGASEKLAIIGRSMDEAVTPYVRALEKSLATRGMPAKVETFSVEAGTMSREAADQVDQFFRDQKRYYTNRELIHSLMFRENLEWARKLKREGYTIIDLGNPKNKPFSLNYEVETNILGF